MTDYGKKRMGDGPTMVGVGRSEWAWVRTGREEFGEAKSNGRASGYWRVACQEDGREDGRAAAEEHLLQEVVNLRHAARLGDADLLVHP